MRLVVTRPQEDSERLALRLIEMGHVALFSPVLYVVHYDNISIPKLDYQAIAITSANGSRALSGNPIIESIATLPVFTVGAQSAEAALRIGLRNARATGGDVNLLVAGMLASCSPQLGPVLYLSGREVAGDLEGSLRRHGFTVKRVILYETAAASSLTKEVDNALSKGEVDGVLLYSQRSAQVWRHLVENSGLAKETNKIRHYCLSSKVAAVLQPDYVTLTPQKPDETSLLALLDPPR